MVALVRHGRFSWFGGHQEHENVLAYSSVEVAGVYRGRNRKTWGECVKDGMKLLGLQTEWDTCKDFILGKSLTLAECGRNGCFKIRCVEG